MDPDVWAGGWNCCPGRVVDDIPTFGLMAGVVILAVGDIRKLVTETIQFGLGSHSETQSHDIS